MREDYYCCSRLYCKTPSILFELQSRRLIAYFEVYIDSALHYGCVKIITAVVDYTVKPLQPFSNCSLALGINCLEF